MTRLRRSPALAPAQGDTYLCWAASLVLAADYQGYAMSPGSLGGHDIRTPGGLEGYIESVAGVLSLSENRTGFVGTDASPGKVEKLARLPGMGIDLAPPAARTHEGVKAYVRHWIERDCPVLLRWRPGALGRAGYGGEHFGVVVEWTPTRAAITDSYAGERGDRCEILPLEVGYSDTHWRRLQAVAVRPARRGSGGQ